MPSPSVTLSDPSQELAKFRATCESLRELLQRIVVLKKEGADSEQLRRVCTESSLLLLELKATNRATHLATHAARCGVQEQKATMEALHLRLQNLLYEKDHLLREIERCRAFDTREVDTIELLPEAEAQAAHNLALPPALSDTATPAEVQARGRSVQLARLQHEMEVRRSMQGTLAELKLRVRQLDADLAERDRHLQGLPAVLKQIEAASQPAQKYMGLPVSSRRRRQAAARNLPPALYTLYAQVEAYADVHPNVASVHIREDVAASPGSGTVAGAGAASSGMSAGSSAAAGGATAAATANAAQLKLKRNRDGGPSASAIAAAADALAVHETESVPKAVVLDLVAADDVDEAKMKPAGASRRIVFEMNAALELVTARVEREGGSPTAGDIHDDRTLLLNLYPADDGRSAPNAALYVRASEAARLNKRPGAADGAISEEALHFGDATRQARPYRWVQWLAGLYVTPTEFSERMRPEPSTAAAMRRLRSRIASRASLRQQLRTFAASPPPPRPALPPSVAQLFPASSNSTLHNWVELAPTDPLLVTNPFPSSPDAGRGGVEDKAEGAGEGCVDGAEEGCRFFKATLKRGAASLMALVEVPPDYPERAPRWLLQGRAAATSVSACTTYDNTLRQIETEVNAYYNELLLEGDEDWLLSLQLRRVQMCFDVIGEGTAAPLPLGRKRRGRNRAPRLRLHGSQMTHR